MLIYAHIKAVNCTAKLDSAEGSTQCPLINNRPQKGAYWYLLWPYALLHELLMSRRIHSTTDQHETCIIWLLGASAWAWSPTAHMQKMCVGLTWRLLQCLLAADTSQEWTCPLSSGCSQQLHNKHKSQAWWKSTCHGASAGACLSQAMQEQEDCTCICGSGSVW